MVSSRGRPRTFENKDTRSRTKHEEEPPPQGMYEEVYDSGRGGRGMWTPKRLALSDHPARGKA